MDPAQFRDRYGPWALIAGASEGVGAALARELAARDVNVLLLARRQGALDEVAASITESSGAQARTLTVDLASDGAVERIVDATDDLEIGLFVYCAGADA